MCYHFDGFEASIKTLVSSYLGILLNERVTRQKNKTYRTELQTDKTMTIQSCQELDQVPQLPLPLATPQIGGWKRSTAPQVGCEH